MSNYTESPERVARILSALFDALAAEGIERVGVTEMQDTIREVLDRVRARSHAH